MSASQEPSAEDRLDPVYLHARRELRFLLIVFTAAVVWALSVSYLLGYVPAGESIDPDQVATMFGLPAWVWWGILAPWLVIDVVTVVFCLAVMKDDDLGPDDEAATEAPAEVKERGGAA